MSDKIRVHTLAKVLGVSSKAILEKCRAEGLDLKNHMSTLAVGLEATVREWFSDGVHMTTVETAERVNLKKVKVKRSAKRETEEKAVDTSAAQAPETSESEVSIGDVSVAVAEAPPVEPAAETLGAGLEVKEPEAPPEFPVVMEPPVAAPEEEPPAEAPTVPAEAAEITQPKEAAEVKTPEAEPELEPEPVQPVGPQNIPTPAQLRGPKVIRVEAPEEIRPRSPRYTPSRPRPSQEAATPTGAGTDVGRGGRGGRTKNREGADTKQKSRVHPRRRSGGTQEPGERQREWRDRDLIEREERLKGVTGRAIHTRRAIEKRPGAGMPIPGRLQKVQLSEPIRMKEFCSATGLPFTRLFGKLKDRGLAANINMTLTSELAEELAIEFDIEVDITRAKTLLDVIKEEFENRDRKNLRLRPPVVTFLGHVDHGKTSLLDRIRQTNVAAGEAGGITQHMGSYQIEHEGGMITFLDTPGHEAFTAMRARGANMTDVVVLVVAADDGVMPQTIEAINHAKAAGVPIVVALNKIDLPSVGNLNKIYADLATHDLAPTSWGGDTDVINTSAVTGEGVDELLTHLVLLSDALELMADPEVSSSGTIIEGSMKEGVGPVARMLVQEGTLKTGDVIVCGAAYGRIRSLLDDCGKRLAQAPSSCPVEVSGLDEVPQAGDRFYKLDSLRRAKEVADEDKNRLRGESLVGIRKMTTLEHLLTRSREGEIPELNVIIKSDTYGTLDVLKKTLVDLSTEEVKLTVLHGAVGGINESDVLLATASNAIIIGFQVVPEPGSQKLADGKGVQIRQYRVIYKLTDDMKKAMEGLLAPEEHIEARGKLEVREVFRITKVGLVAGCFVTEGLVGRNHFVRVIRDSVVVRDDCTLVSLRHFKDDVREVRAGYECGLRIEGFEDLKPGDIIEAYEAVQVARTL